MSNPPAAMASHVMGTASAVRIRCTPISWASSLPYGFDEAFVLPALNQSTIYRLLLREDILYAFDQIAATILKATIVGSGSPSATPGIIGPFGPSAALVVMIDGNVDLRDPYQCPEVVEEFWRALCLYTRSQGPSGGR
jgi:hypothetical protein